MKLIRDIIRNKSTNAELVASEGRDDGAMTPHSERIETAKAEPISEASSVASLDISSIDLDTLALSNPPDGTVVQAERNSRESGTAARFFEKSLPDLAYEDDHEDVWADISPEDGEAGVTNSPEMAAPPSDDPFSDEIGQEPETKAVSGDQLQESVGPAEDSLSEPLRLMPEFLADKPVDISKAVEVPSPAAGRNKNRAGRAKTRLLGFSSSQDTAENPFAKGANTQEDGYTSFPVGWLVVTDGPGRGSGFTLFNGVAQIGRGEGQTVRLDFGDNSISRQNHAAIAYDAEQNTFFIGHGGKANLVRCNDMPVLSTQALGAGDRIRIGETTLHFVPLCGSEFHWPEQMIDEIPHAVRG